MGFDKNIRRLFQDFFWSSKLLFLKFLSLIKAEKNDKYYYQFWLSFTIIRRTIQFQPILNYENKQ